MNLGGSKRAGENKLNINLENCSFLWFVLYNYTTMHWFECAFCVFYCNLH